MGKEVPSSTDRSSKPHHGLVCSLCGRESLLALYTASDKKFGTTQENFRIEFCPFCKVGETVPRPERGKLSDFYPEGYYPTQHVSCFTSNVVLQRFQHEKIRAIQRFRRSGRLLDIGCGIGLFIKFAAAHGYQTQGIEWSEIAAREGRRAWNLDIIRGDFLETSLPESQFDIVTCWHVLEHLLQPREAIVKAHQLLSREGLLVIAVPNFNSYQARVFRRHWYHLDVPRHLFHFTPEGLSDLVKGAGFRVEAIAFHSAEHNASGILGSLMRISPPGESLAHKAVRKVVGAPICKLLAAEETSLNRGGTFTLTAVKC